jgi:ubiquinone/menaquinone biosynthesis C-methylase UbiE
MGSSSRLLTIDEASFEADQYRRASFEIWEAMAPGWEGWRAQLADGLSPVREWLISELAPNPGETVLELGAGAGDTGFAATAILGEHGHLISSDFSPAMVEVARRRGAQLGLRNVKYRVMDAEQIALDTNSIDGVLCQNGYMLMADPATALSETGRVLRAGGRLALSVWGAPEHNPWASIGGRMLVERGHLPAPEPGAPSVFSMASEERTRSLLDRAGFADIRIEEVPVHFAFRDLDDYMRWVIDVAGPFAIVVRSLPEDERRVLRAHLEEAFVAFEAAGGYSVPGMALCAVASHAP